MLQVSADLARHRRQQHYDFIVWIGSSQFVNAHQGAVNSKQKMVVLGSSPLLGLCD